MPKYWACTDAAGNKFFRDSPCPEPAPPTDVQSEVQQPVEAPVPSVAEVQQPKGQQRTASQAQRIPAKPASALMVWKSFAGLFWIVLLGLLAIFVVKIWLKHRRARAPLRGSYTSSQPYERVEPSSDMLGAVWSSKASPTSVPERPTEWSMELIRKLEWKRFEELCAGYWQAKNHRAELTGKGEDGGVDINLYSRSEPERLVAIVQCKAWDDQVGVEKVRELWGVKSHLGVPLAIFYGRSGYTGRAREFAAGKHLKLFTGEELLSQIISLSTDQQNELMQRVTRGDYMTPTCARCDLKMVWRANAKFWGCVNYPRCESKIYSKQPLNA